VNTFRSGKLLPGDLATGDEDGFAYIVRLKGQKTVQAKMYAKPPGKSRKAKDL
jgi:hypothetical protein